MTVRNAVDTIDECLDSILGQDYPEDKFELIVVDAGSSDGTRERILRYQNVTLLDDPHGTIGSGRNVGIRHSSGSIIAITDADIVVEKSWLRTASAELLESPRTGAVGGPILTHPNCKGFAALVGELREESPRFSRRTEPPHDMLYTRNIAYQRKALESAGLFNKTLVAAEDPELNWRIQDCGYSLVFQPAMRVYHHHRSTLQGFLRQRYRNGVGCGQLLHVNRRLRKTSRRLVTAMAFPLGIVTATLFLLTEPPAAADLFYLGVIGFTAVCMSRGLELYRRTRRLPYLFGSAFLTGIAWLAWSLEFLRGMMLSASASAPRL